FLDFGCRDVLALPAEGVADAIDEIEIAVFVLAHQIAGSEPAVSFCEHVVQDLPVGLCLTGVALEPLARPRCILEDLADDLAQPISEGQPQLVRALLVARRRSDEIPAKLADILKAGAVPAYDVVPEFARRKFIADHH